MSNFIKNIDNSKVLVLKELVKYDENKVVSLTLSQNDAISITVFAFAQGEGLSTHTAPGDALVNVLDGEAEITINGVLHFLKAGECIVMPAGIPHSLEAKKAFKMLLTIVKK